MDYQERCIGRSLAHNEERGFGFTRPRTTSAVPNLLMLQSSVGNRVVNALIQRQPSALNNAVLQRIGPSPATFEDTLHFVLNEAGFYQGKGTITGNVANLGTPPGTKSGQQFGRLAHARLGEAIESARALNWPGANRLIADVRIDPLTGKVIVIGIPPGGRGTLNFNFVVLKPGQTLQIGDVLHDKALMTGDAKYGKVSTNVNQAAYARRHGLGHVNLSAGNFVTEFAVSSKLSRLAMAWGQKISRQGSFVRIGTMGFISIATTAGIVLSSEDRLNAALVMAADTVMDIPLAMFIARLTGSAGVGVLLSMAVSMESDNPAHNQVKAEAKMIYEFIYESVPGAVRKYRHCLAGLGWACTDWQYEAKDQSLYNQAYQAVVRLLDDPYELQAAD